MYFELRESDIDRHLQSDGAKALLAHWQRCSEAAGGIPNVAEVWSEAIAPHLAHVATAEPAGEDWRNSFVGEALASEQGVEWRSEVSGSPDPQAQAFARRCFARVRETGRPVFAIHTLPEARNVLLWERLMLPAVRADGSFIIVLYLRPLEFVEGLVRSVLDTMPTGIIRARCIRDDRGRIVDAVCLLSNAQAAEFLRRAPDELHEGCLLELFPAFLEGDVFSRLVDVVETAKAASFEMEHVEGGRARWFNLAAVPQGDGFTLTLADITAMKLVNIELERARNELLRANLHLEEKTHELEAAIADARNAHADLEAEVECRKVLEEELRRLALTDALTGLANRPALAAHGQALAAASNRRGVPLSAVAIDVDHFKSINDAHGHAVGDRVLAAIAGILDGAIRRDIDMAGRIGGEEFIVVLQRTDLAQAQAFAERLRQTLAARVIETERAGISVTASFGVAQFRSGEEFEDMLVRCDEALYRAKREGRNRVATATEAEQRAA